MFLRRWWCLSRFSIVAKVFQKTAGCASKKFFELFFDISTFKIEHPSDNVSIHTCKTQQPLTCCTPIVTCMSSEDTPTSCGCPLQFAGLGGLPKSLGVTGVLRGPGGGFRGRGTGVRPCDGRLCGGLLWLAGWGLAGRLVCLRGGGPGALLPPCALLLWPFAIAPWRSSQWQSKNVPPRCTLSPLCRTAPTLPPPLHGPNHLPLFHPQRWACECSSPPLLPLTPLRLPLPGPPSFCLILFFYPPWSCLSAPFPCGLPLALAGCCLLFFGGLGGSR